MNFKNKNKRDSHFNQTPQNLTKSIGTISVHPDGFGFFSHKDDPLQPNVFVPANLVGGMLPTDVVEIEWSKDDERTKAYTCKVVQRNARKFAIVHTTRDVLIPLSAWGVNLSVKHRTQCTIPDEDQVWIASFSGDNTTGNIDVLMDKCIGPISSWKNRHTGLLLDAEHPSEDINAQNMEASAKDAVASMQDDERANWSSLTFLTVDGENTKDFDDAVCVSPRSDGGWKVRVAIADVSSLVKVGSDLDVAAQARGATVYLPGDVRPMFPSYLSDGACSLIEGVDRNVLGVSVNFSKDGEVVGEAEFSMTKVKVSARLSYQDVEEWHAGIEKEFDIRVQQCLESWREWSESQIQAEDVLFPWQKSEHYINVDVNGIVSCETSKPTPKASKMVEIAMVAANRAAAQYIHRMYGIGAFRNHKEPDWLAGYDFLEKAGWPAGMPPTANAKQWWVDAFKKAEGRSDAWMLAQAWTKMQSAAEYQVENKGHHALAASAYVHFTSPIRRYADLEVHRAIKAAIMGETYDTKRWEGVVSDCNISMKRSKQIERQIRSLWMSKWWSQQSPEFKTSATVRALKRDGAAFIITDAYGSEGLLIPGDTEYEVGSKVEVKLYRVNGANVLFEAVII
jgi:ribonuclease R